MPTVVATIIPLAGRLDDVEAVLRDLAPQVHQEDGCEKYALHRGRDRIVVIERWRDGAALGAHGQGPAIKTMGQRLAGLVSAAPDVQILEPVEAGDPARGRI
jgi:quinol monooxygenase YgiN